MSVHLGVNAGGRHVYVEYRQEIAPVVQRILAATADPGKHPDPADEAEVARWAAAHPDRLCSLPLDCDHAPPDHAVQWWKGVLRKRGGRR